MITDYIDLIWDLILLLYMLWLYQEQEERFLRAVYLFGIEIIKFCIILTLIGLLLERRFPNCYHS